MKRSPRRRSMHSPVRVFARGTSVFRGLTVAPIAAGFSTYALLYCVQPLRPVFSSGIDVIPLVASLSFSLATATLALAMLVAGRVSDVLGRKPMMAASLFAVGLCVFAGSWRMLLVLRA